MILLAQLMILYFSQISDSILAIKQRYVLSPVWEYSLPSGEGIIEVFLDTATARETCAIYIASGIFIQNNLGKSLLLKLNDDGALVWQDYSSYKFSSPFFVFSDVNLDRIADPIIVSERIIVYDGLTGNIIYQPLIDVLGYIPSVNADDVNADKETEIAVTNAAGFIRMVNINANKILWERNVLNQSRVDSFSLMLDILAPPPQSVISYDSTSKKYRIYLISNSSNLFCLDAVSGNTIWDYTIENGYFIATPLILDCNLDGKIEVVAAARNSKGYFNLFVFAADDGKLIWRFILAEGFVNDPIVRYFILGDIPIFLLTSNDWNKLYFVEGKEGLTIGEFNLPFSVQNAMICDINIDGMVDVIFFSHEGDFEGKLHNMYVYEIVPIKSPHFEAELKILNDIPVDDRWAWGYKTRPPILAPKWYYSSKGEYRFINVFDIDGDKVVEVITLSRGEHEQKFRVWRIIPTSKK